MAREPKGYVYFVLCRTTNLVKIGFSQTHPDKRLAMFRLGSAAPLDRLGYIRDDVTLERRLHARFKHLREHGEWFRFDDELGDYVEEHASAWRMRNRSSSEDWEQSEVSRDSYDEIATRLMWEWTWKHCEGFAPEPVEHVNFFEFCLHRGFRFRKSDRSMVKMVKGKPTIVCYEYQD